MRGARDCILAREPIDLRRQPEQIFRCVGIGVGIGFVGRMDKDALPRIVGDQRPRPPATIRTQIARMAGRKVGNIAGMRQMDSTARPANSAIGSQKFRASHGVLYGIRL